MWTANDTPSRLSIGETNARSSANVPRAKHSSRLVGGPSPVARRSRIRPRAYSANGMLSASKMLGSQFQAESTTLGSSHADRLRATCASVVRRVRGERFVASRDLSVAGEGGSAAWGRSQAHASPGRQHRDRVLSEGGIQAINRLCPGPGYRAAAIESLYSRLI